MTVADVRLAQDVDARALLAGLDATKADWLRQYARRLVLLDLAILVAASLVSTVLRFGSAAPDTHFGPVTYLLGSLALVPVWMATLMLSRCYETRFLGNGSEEFRRVANASFRVLSAVMVLLVMTKADVSRGFLAIALPIGLVSVVAGRYAGRLWLHAQRRRGRCMHSVVVVGAAAQALEMTTSLQSHPFSGLQVVGACVVGDAKRYAQGSLVPVLGELTDVLPVLEELGADTVVVAKGPGITPDGLRRLSYELEGTGVDLYVSPALTNVTGSRIHWRTMPGLALLHVEEPELGGSRRLVKAVFDRLVGLGLLLVAAPALLAVAVAIKVTSPGPVFYRQERIGKDGSAFRIWKFRSMYVDADARKASLAHLSQSAVYFKVQDDPRITPMGRFIRRYSIDELPQLLNVVSGHMSLVGPRPQVQSEVDAYTGHLHRRLLVKPGMTGLWQVSGRNDLDVEDSVRLDLHYVENWSLGLDVAVLCKTVLAVLRPSGAY